jgi:hypothetical protein
MKNNNKRCAKETLQFLLNGSEWKERSLNERKIILIVGGGTTDGWELQF